MNSWVRWSQWTGEGMVNFGQMPVRDIAKYLQAFEMDAKEVLEKTGADHVLYGVKQYEDGTLTEVRFYMIPMDDEQFEKDVANKRGIVVFALHKRK
mgnify:FL=1